MHGVTIVSPTSGSIISSGSISMTEMSGIAANSGSGKHSSWIGHYAAYRAMELACDLARETGMAGVGVPVLDTQARAVAALSVGTLAERLNAGGGVDLRIHRDVDVTPDRIPAVLGDAEVAIIDHTHLPTDIALKCKGLRHVVFLGTGARSYMNPEELEAARGISVHIIKGYGDTAVAEMAFALMWAAALSVSSTQKYKVQFAPIPDMSSGISIRPATMSPPALAR